MLEKDYCTPLCETNLGTKDVSEFKLAIKRGYHHNWIIDNLPAASIIDDDSISRTNFVGFPVGFVEGTNYYVYNHVNILLHYHTIAEGEHRIVAFYVEPYSIKHKFKTPYDGKGELPPLASCPTDQYVSHSHSTEKQKVGTGPLIFSYGVKWEPSKVTWASRWDIYLSMNHAIPDKVHWFSIINSLVIVLFLAFMVAMILVRTLNKDISKYNRVTLLSHIILYDHVSILHPRIESKCALYCLL